MKYLIYLAANGEISPFVSKFTVFYELFLYFNKNK